VDFPGGSLGVRPVLVLNFAPSLTSAHLCCPIRHTRMRPPHQRLRSSRLMFTNAEARSHVAQVSIGTFFIYHSLRRNARISETC
jgi:hypothetical protein